MCEEFTQNEIVDQDENVFLTVKSDRTEIYEKETKKLILRNFPYSVINDVNFFPDNLDGYSPEGAAQRGYNIFSAHEGIVISVFWYKKWYMVKNKKLNIFASKWAAKKNTFGKHFFQKIYEIVSGTTIEILTETEDEQGDEFSTSDMIDYISEIFEKNLDKNKKYIFLLEPNDEERIVVKLNQPKLLFLASCQDDKFNFEEELKLNDRLVEKPKQYFFKTKEELEKELNKIDHLKFQGFIIIQKGQENDIHYKIFNFQYHYFFSLRNNTPSLFFRFLQLYTSSCKDKNISLQKLRDFCLFYDFDKQKAFELIWYTCNSLYGLYHEKFVKKKDITLPIKINEFLNFIHHQYQKDFIYTSKDKILSILEKSHPVKINQLIKEIQKKDAQCGPSGCTVDGSVN